MDWRLTPTNGRVAAQQLHGKVEAERFTDGEARQVSVPVCDLRKEPHTMRRERQLLFGDTFTVLEDRDGFAFGQSGRDGYCGYVRSADLQAAQTATHIVGARGTHAYSAPNIKIPEIMALSFGSKLSVEDEDGRFVRTHEGHYLPWVHVRALDRPFSDPVAVAEVFLGTPYLWGGNSGAGIDCSGLVQAALLACGIGCPGDSDLQEQALGQPLSDVASTRRGDLFFWKGHVAMAVDDERLIHANGHTMSVAYEPIKATIARIEAAGEGPVTSRRRI